MESIDPRRSTTDAEQEDYQRFVEDIDLNYDYHLFGCGVLREFFKERIAPVLGDYIHFKTNSQIERSLMGEFIEEFSGTPYREGLSFTEFILGLPLVTDIKDALLEELYYIFKQLTEDVVTFTKGTILNDTKVLPGYSLLLTTITYNDYEERRRYSDCTPDRKH